MLLFRITLRQLFSIIKIEDSTIQNIKCEENTDGSALYFENAKVIMLSSIIDNCKA